MALNSHDAVINAITSGRFYKQVFNKNFLPTTPAVAGEWHCLARGGGYPAADTLYNTGTNLAFQASNDVTNGAGGIQHGGNVSPMKKYLTGASIYTAAATSAPAMVYVVDLVGFYRVTSVTTITAQTLNNTVTLPRFTGGKGVLPFIWNTNATALGAATPTITLNYTNQDGTAGRTTPTLPSLPIGKTAASNGLVLYSGTGTGKYGPFMPLQGGDTGVRSIQSIQISASYVSGEFSIGLAKVLAVLPITAIGVATERDLINQLGGAPEIPDGANIHLLLNSGAATPVNTSYFGHLDFVWD